MKHVKTRTMARIGLRTSFELQRFCPNLPRLRLPPALVTHLGQDATWRHSDARSTLYSQLPLSMNLRLSVASLGAGAQSVVHSRQLWSALLTAWVIGCSLDLPPVNKTGDVLVTDDAGTGGSTGGAPVDDDVGPDDDDDPGGGGSGGEVSGCGPGEVECEDGACVPEGQPCTSGCDPTACAETPVPNATLSCDAETDACDVLNCLPGFVDCDGDPTNGCEANFNGMPNMQAGMDTQLQAYRLDTSYDFTGFPTYTFSERCTCDYPELPTLEGNLPPGQDDLSAVFSLGWTATDGLIVHVLIKDDAFVIQDYDRTQEVLAEGTHPREQDNLELIYHGLPGSGSEDDQHYFVNYLGQPASEANKPIEVAAISTSAGVTAGGCIEMTLQLTGNFLSGKDGVDEALVPEATDVFVFDLAINDVDYSGEDPSGAPERQHHVFYKNPGDAYWYTSGQQDTSEAIGTVVLLEALPAAQ